MAPGTVLSAVMHTVSGALITDRISEDLTNI